MLYKQHRITNKIPTCVFQFEDIEKFIEFTTKLHEECVKQVIQDIISKNFIQINLNSADPKEIKGIIDSQYKLLIEIFGMDGEYINILSLEEISSSDIPHKISKIRIGNSSLYEIHFGNKPNIYFEITIDFKPTKIFDLISTPSNSTFNESQIEVFGRSSTMVSGLSANFQKFFVNFKANHGIIHLENIYDILLWLGFFPVLLIFLIKYQSKIPEIVVMAPVVVQLVISLTGFFILALFFRLLFNLGRWLYPYMEIASQTSNERKIFKAIYSIAIVAIFGAIAIHLGRFFWNALVG